MKKILLLLVAGVGLLGASQVTWAAEVTITGTVTPVALGRACSNAGGSFNSNDSGYSCVKENCNGKGGTCSVQCGSNGKCTGDTPPMILPSGGVTLLGLLQNGNNVYYQQSEPSGAPQSLSGSAGNAGASAAPAAPSPPPPVIIIN